MPDTRVGTLDHPERYDARSVSIYENSKGYYFKMDGSREPIHGNQLWTTLEHVKMRGSVQIDAAPPHPPAPLAWLPWPEDEDDEERSIAAAIEASLHEPQDVAAEATEDAEDADPSVVPVANAAPSEPKRCVICINDDAAVDHMIAPCHHLCLCAGCAPRVRSGRMPCPVCRRAQRSIIRVF
jgi:hypothetical protein